MGKKKYELTYETMLYFGRTLYRIKALKDFSDVKKSDLGGWIEGESNLSQKGNCWIYDNSKVFDDARVYGNARISYAAEVYDRAKVYGNAEVYDDTCVYDKAIISGNAVVYGNVDIYGDTVISGNAKICTFLTPMTTEKNN